MTYSFAFRKGAQWVHAHYSRVGNYNDTHHEVPYAAVRGGQDQSGDGIDFYQDELKAHPEKSDHFIVRKDRVLHN